VDDDGTYELVLARARPASGPARCFCSGRLDDDQRAALDALLHAGAARGLRAPRRGAAEPGPRAA
jgi:hypothetical protein